MLVVRSGRRWATYSSWQEWRRRRRAAGPMAATRRQAPSRACLACYGQRWIYEPGPLGLMPVRCEACS